jgi:hypothetical protein
MAEVCKNCGASVPSTSGFCPACGAKVEGAPAAPVQAGAPPAAYGAAPPKKSGGALKIVLIVIAVVVVLGAAGVGILGYVGYRAMHAAGSSFSMGKNAEVSDAELGVDIYPGAERNASGTMRMNLANNLVVRAAYTTSDPASNVVSYYKDKLGSDATSMQIGPVTTLSSVTAGGGGKDMLTITVTSSTPTQFVIQHTKATTTQ